MLEETGTIRVKRHDSGVTIDVGCKIMALSWEQVDEFMDALYSMMPEAVPSKSIIEEKVFKVTMKDG